MNKVLQTSPKSFIYHITLSETMKVPLQLDGTIASVYAYNFVIQLADCPVTQLWSKTWSLPLSNLIYLQFLELSYPKSWLY